MRTTKYVIAAYKGLGFGVWFHEKGYKKHEPLEIFKTYEQAWQWITKQRFL